MLEIKPGKWGRERRRINLLATFLGQLTGGDLSRLKSKLKWIWIELVCIVEANFMARKFVLLFSFIYFF